MQGGSADARSRRRLGRVVGIGVAYFGGAIVALHVLRPDVDPASAVTSEYAVGPHGALMTSAYFALAGALVALGIGLGRALSRRVADTPGIVLLFLAALGTAVAGLAPVDVGAPRPVTLEGWLHRIAAIVAFASMTGGPLLLVRWFRCNADWRGLAWLGAVTGVLGLVGLACIQLVLLERGLAGAAQRAVLVLVVAWMLASAHRLITTAAHETDTPTSP